VKCPRCGCKLLARENEGREYDDDVCVDCEDEDEGAADVFARSDEASEESEEEEEE
jgi:hypothetical protein